MSIEYGAEVFIRPQEIANDESSSESVLSHVLDKLRHEKYVPDYFVFLQATSPVRKVDDIDRAIQTIIENRCGFNKW